MKKMNNYNPMRWLMYIAVFGLLFDIAGIYIDLTASGSGEIWGIPFNSCGPLNPIAPFRIVFMLIFLYLYGKHSKYAWHVMMLFLILNIPAYWFFRIRGTYLQPQAFRTKDLFTFVVWLGFLFYVIILRPRYMHFLSNLVRGKSRE